MSNTQTVELEAGCECFIAPPDF